MSYAGYRGTITTTGSRGTQGRGDSGYRGTKGTEEQRIRGYKGTAGKQEHWAQRNGWTIATGIEEHRVQRNSGYRGTDGQWVQRYRGTAGIEEQRNSEYRGTLVTAVKWDKTNTKVVIYRIRAHQKNLPILQLKCKIKSELRPCIEQFRNQFSLIHFSVTHSFKKVFILQY